MQAASGLPEPVEHVRRWAADEQRAYQGSSNRPLGWYAALIGAYLLSVTGLSLLVRRRGGFPRRVPMRDLALVTVATHRTARLIAKGKVASPLRAPFTRLEGPGGPAEVDERPRGRGARKAVGELVSCPFCVAQWVGTAFMFGVVLAPRFTRFVAALMTAVAGADYLQFLRARLDQD